MYHGEAVCKPRHNTVVYNRTPRNFFVLFEVEVLEYYLALTFKDSQNQSFLLYEEKLKEATRIGLEIPPCLFIGNGLE